VRCFYVAYAVHGEDKCIYGRRGVEQLAGCSREKAQDSVLIGGPSKMTFGTSNLLVFFLAERYMIIKGVLGSTRPGLHDGLKKIKKS
jgi:hypothetical protein